MRIIGQQHIADIFQVSGKTIVEWQEQGFPVAVRGGAGVPSEYDSGSCIEWLTRREVAKVQAESPRDRLARLQSDEIELRLQERRGALVLAEQIEPMWTAMVGSARAFLRSEVNRLAQLLESAENLEARRDLLSDTFDEFLTRLAGYDPGDEAPSEIPTNPERMTP